MQYRSHPWDGARDTLLLRRGDPNRERANYNPVLFVFNSFVCFPPHVIVRNKSASRSQPSAAAVAVNSNSSSSLCFFPFLFHTELQRCFIDPTIHGPLETNCEVEKGRSAGLAGWVWWWDERQPLVDAPGHFLQGLRLPRSN